MTPLLAASVTGHLHIVEHLIGKNLTDFDVTFIIDFFNG